jgi:hypothetical protein
VLTRAAVDAEAASVLAAHNIAEDRSPDVRDRGCLPAQCRGVLAGTAEHDFMPVAPDPT